ncbi:MAG: DUF4097 family beta strand repeat protein [Clostridia bacterium]|nr:DUF4097 family beta strand repeat protein [Clostridia bacterium]
MLFILWPAPTLLWGAELSIFAFATVGVVILICARNLIPRYVDDSARSYPPSMFGLFDLLATVLLACGIGLCILSILPSALLPSDLGLALMFVSVALGVGMILFSVKIRPTLDAHAKKEGAGCETAEGEGGGKQRRLRWLLPLVIVCCAVSVCGTLFAFALQNDFQVHFFFASGDGAKYNNRGDAVVEVQVNSIHVDWIAGSVTVEPYAGDKVEIVETQGGAAVKVGDEQLRWYVSGGALHIRFDGKSNWFRWQTSLDKDLTVRVPDRQLGELSVDAVSANVTLRDLSIERGVKVSGVSGAICISNLTQKSLKIHTVSGDIALDGGNADHLELEGVSARLSVKDFLCGTVKAESTSGNVALERVSFDSLSLETVSGDVLVTLATIAREIELETVSGNVNLLVPADLSGFCAELDGASGEFISSIATTKRGDTYLFGDGSMRIDMDTSSGDLTIEYTQ